MSWASSLSISGAQMTTADIVLLCVVVSAAGSTAAVIISICCAWRDATMSGEIDELAIEAERVRREFKKLYGVPPSRRPASLHLEPQASERQPRH